MVTLLAIAITRPGLMDLQAILVAEQDAHRFYRTLASAVGPDFDHRRSVCLADPTAAEVRMVITRTACRLTSSDLLVIYFSGHGCLDQGRLFLPFGDARPDGSGQLGVREVGEWLVRSQAKRVIILDCCHSGAALSLANLTDVYEPARTAVLSSTGALQRSSYRDSGSDFTSTLCAAIQLAEFDERALSLNALVDSMLNQGCDAVLNLPEGNGDLVIPCGTPRSGLPKRFGDDFISEVLESATVERQYLWFELTKVPIRSRFSVLESYLNGNYPSEPSWLVRRAIGTALESCQPIGTAWENLTLSLVKSADWMKSCIGLIGARKVLGQGHFLAAVRGSVSPVSNIDAAWIASLYLSDANVDALPLVIQSRLGGSTWGRIDLLNRWALNAQSEGAAADQILFSAGESALRAAATHCKLLGRVPRTLEGIGYDASVVNSRLVKFLYDARRRGRTAAPHLKFLLSALYGNWRDQLQIDVREWLRTLKQRDAIRELEHCAGIPAVEPRMALFLGLNGDHSLGFDPFPGLIWGLTDSHPWVRREAIRALARFAPERVGGGLDGLIDTSYYPGILDLLLECSHQGVDTARIIKQAELTPNELNAMQWATRLVHPLRK